MPQKKSPSKPDPAKKPVPQQKLVLNPASDDSEAINESPGHFGVAPEGGYAGAKGPTDVRPHKLMDQMNNQPRFGDGGSQEVSALLEALKQPGVLERLMQLIGGGQQQGGM